MTENIVVWVAPSDTYKNATYGIVLKSVTEHHFYGAGIHNRHHGHVLQVWDNIEREQEDGTYLDPMRERTTERYSYMWSPQANVISAHPQQRAQEGESMTLGDTVELRLFDSGYVLGTFVVEAKSLHDPHLSLI